MRVYAELEEAGHMVKIRLFYEGQWYAMIITASMLEKLQHSKGEEVRYILGVS